MKTNDILRSNYSCKILPASIIWNLLGKALLSRRERKRVPMATDLIILNKHDKKPTKMSQKNMKNENVNIARLKRNCKMDFYAYFM